MPEVMTSAPPRGGGPATDPLPSLSQPPGSEDAGLCRCGKAPSDEATTYNFAALPVRHPHLSCHPWAPGLREGVSESGSEEKAHEACVSEGHLALGPASPRARPGNF